MPKFLWFSCLLDYKTLCEYVPTGSTTRRDRRNNPEGSDQMIFCYEILLAWLTGPKDFYVSHICWR